VGRYLLVERLAVGGMAEVFLACERADGPIPRDRLVVLKRILPHLAQNPEFVDAFAREARIAARIRHPNVVEIHELGEAMGLPYIAMEYLPGTTLKELLHSARAADASMPVDVALHLLRQACEGAHAAHELTDPSGRPYGLVHRDITPHNLMVDDAATLKLLDFGIAKASEGMESTRTGVLKGKIAYMSPEQCRQERLDRRADVFSLGVVAYQLLTGRKPFARSSELATMQAIILGRHERVDAIRPEVPAAVADVIEQALASSASARPATAMALWTALKDAADRSGIAVEPAAAVDWVGRYLGPAIHRRRSAIDQALSRTLESYDDVRLDTESLERARLSDHGRTPLPVPSRPPASPASEGWKAVAALTLAFLAIVATLGWVGSRSPAVDAASAAGNLAQPVLDRPPIAAVVAPVTDPAAILRDLEPVRLYLQAALRRPLTLSVSASYADAGSAVIDGDVAFAFLPANTIAHARREKPADAAGLHVLAVQVVDGSTSSDAYLVVRRDDPAQTAQDLVGRRVCWVDPLSNTGYALPRAWLKTQGLDPDSDLAPHMSGNHQQVLRDVLAGRCDVGATFSGNWLTSDQRGIATAQLRILAITGSSAHDGIVSGPGLGEADTRALREALLAYDPPPSPVDSASQAITGFLPPPTGYADPIRTRP
jgi:phosphate/phosphite/phosphonate ABC transporter binding protein